LFNHFVVGSFLLTSTIKYDKTKTKIYFCIHNKAIRNASGWGRHLLKNWQSNFLAISLNLPTREMLFRLNQCRSDQCDRVDGVEDVQQLFTDAHTSCIGLVQAHLMPDSPAYPSDFEPINLAYDSHICLRAEEIVCTHQTLTFCELGVHGKLYNPTCFLSGIKVWALEEEEEKQEGFLPCQTPTSSLRLKDEE
jgi:hypothetical protein